MAKGSSLNLMSAHNQWANRPADERFWNLADLKEFLDGEKPLTRAQKVGVNKLRAVDLGGDVCLQGEKGNPAQLTNWSFQQLSTMCKAPASYLRTLPADLAVQNLNHGLKAIGSDGARECGVMFRSNGNLLIRSVTGEDYGRIWNLDLVNRLDVATQHGWITPPARPCVDDPRARKATPADILPNQGNFGLSVKVGDMIAPAGVYCGDRDMFVFLVNPDRVIDDGSGGLMRGVFIWNSEVGAGAFKIRTFYLENVCGNHICWGASGVTDIKIIHKEGAIRKWGQKMVAQLKEYSDMSVSEEALMVKRARTFVLGQDREKVVDFLFERKALGLSRVNIEGAYDMAEKWEHTAKAPPTTAWGFVHGLTRYSQDRPYADERHNLDKIGGRILKLAAGGKSY